MVTEADLERIINSPGTKSERARALYRLGCDRTDAVELLGMNYSQAHSVWKEFHSGSSLAARAPNRTMRNRRTGSGETDDQLGPSTSGNHSGRRLDLRPAQTRFITQDGHVVLKSLSSGGTCTNCDKEITFSLRYLGFIHTDSKKEPTKLEDYYD